MSRPPRPPASPLRRPSSALEAQFVEEMNKSLARCDEERKMMSSALATLDLRNNLRQAPPVHSDLQNSLFDHYNCDLEKTKNLLKSCKEEAVLTSRGLKSCIAKNQEMKSKFDELVKDGSVLIKGYRGLEKDFEDCRETNEKIIRRNEDLHGEMNILEKENEELLANLKEIERKVNLLTEERRIWDEEKQSLLRQLDRK